MKIAFLMNHFDRTDTTKYSRSVGYYMIKNFRNAGADVFPIAPKVSMEIYYKLKQAVYKYIFQKKHLRFTEINLIKKEAKKRDKIIKEINPDYIFSFGPISSIFLDCNIPIAYWADACFPGLYQYNPNFSNLSKKTIDNFNLIEQLGFNRAKAVFYSSKWALDAAVNNYKVDSNKLYIVPLGANIEIKHDINFIKDNVNSKLNNNICKFVFVGTSWKYKGADTAIKIINQLNKRGFKASLVIIGCSPYKYIELPDFVKVINFIDTSTEKGMEELIGYYKEANFFLLPTIVESFGHVFCEANAYGLPVISYNTGGISSVITNDKNGYLFDLNANIEEFCDYIVKVYNDKHYYYNLCLNSFYEYKNRLNWKSGVESIIKILNNSK